MVVKVVGTNVRLVNEFHYVSFLKLKFHAMKIKNSDGSYPKAGRALKRLLGSLGI